MVWCTSPFPVTVAESTDLWKRTREPSVKGVFKSLGKPQLANGRHRVFALRRAGRSEPTKRRRAHTRFSPAHERCPRYDTTRNHSPTFESFSFSKNLFVFSPSICASDLLEPMDFRCSTFLHLIQTVWQFSLLKKSFIKKLLTCPLV